MPRVEAQVGDQTIRYDHGAIAAAYASLPHGDADECGCIFCKNFAAQRDVIYPASFRDLLELLGADPSKEGEAFEYGPADDGCHVYGGWFYLVGEMVAAGEQNTTVADCHDFQFWFTAKHPDASGFHEEPVLAVEFTAHLKWVLADCPRDRA